jgi:hypothetical protein
MLPWGLRRQDARAAFKERRILSQGFALLGLFAAWHQSAQRDRHRPIGRRWFGWIELRKNGCTMAQSNVADFEIDFSNDFWPGAILLGCARGQKMLDTVILNRDGWRDVK